jgi:hypothetical protein
MTCQLLHREQICIRVKQIRAKGASEIVGRKLLDSSFVCSLSDQFVDPIPIRSKMSQFDSTAFVDRTN